MTDLLPGPRPAPPATGRVHVVTGTSTCLDPDQASRLGIALVPLRISCAGRDYRDTFDVSAAEVYGMLRERRPLTTSSAPPADYAAAFAAAPGPVVCLTEGSLLSGSHGSALIAAQLVTGRRIEVVDTGTAGGGLRLLALAAARLADQGLDLAELTRRIGELCLRVEMAGMLETVEFLARGGRVPELAFWGSSLLRVRPVARFKAGRGHLAALVRSPSKGIRELHSLVRREAARQGAGPEGERLHCTVFHGDAPALAGHLLDSLRGEFAAADLSISECTPAMGVHTGPGVVGHALYVDP